MAKQETEYREVNRDDLSVTNIDDKSRALLARQSDALAKLAFARADFEQVKAEIYRAIIDHHFIDYW